MTALGAGYHVDVVYKPANQLGRLAGTHVVGERGAQVLEGARIGFNRAWVERRRLGGPLELGELGSQVRLLALKCLQPVVGRLAVSAGADPVDQALDLAREQRQLLGDRALAALLLGTEPGPFGVIFAERLPHHRRREQLRLEPHKDAPLHVDALHSPAIVARAALVVA